MVFINESTVLLTQHVYYKLWDVSNEALVNVQT